MQRQKIGDLLMRLVPLSMHDVDEILHEQRSSHRRFGETAISMGLCRPEHVWRAWCGQTSDEVERIDLDEVGVDAQATFLIPREIANQLNLVPVRASDRTLVVATSQQHFAEAAEQLPRHVHFKLRFVIAPEEQIQAALSRYYAG